MSDTNKPADIVDRINDNVGWLRDWEPELIARFAEHSLLIEAADTIAELRTELAAERGEAEGALPGWTADIEGLWTLGRIAEVDRADLDGWRWYVGRDVKHYSGIVSRGIERTARAAMRAAEAEARRLGLLGEVKS